MLAYIKSALLYLAVIILSVALWPYALAGLTAYLVAGMKFNRWASSLAALGLVITWRLLNGDWKIYFGGGDLLGWYVELFSGVVNWAIASIFVSFFSSGLAKISEKYRYGSKVRA